MGGCWGLGSNEVVGFPDSVIFTKCLLASNKHELILRSEMYKKPDCVIPLVLLQVWEVRKGPPPSWECIRQRKALNTLPRALDLIPWVLGATDSLRALREQSALGFV